MILAIDVGNTNITAALYTPDGEIRFRSTIKTVKDSTRDQCAINLLDVFRLYDASMESVSGTIISSVVPPLTADLVSAVKLLTGKMPIVVGSGIKTGLNIIAESHGQLGADIVASSVAALQRYTAAAIAKTPGSPEDTTATRRPRLARSRAMAARSASTLLSDRWRRWPGRSGTRLT